MIHLQDFHFLYPHWFYLLPLLLVVWWWLAKQVGKSQAWQHFIDERLRPFVISGQDGVSGAAVRHLLLIAGLVAIVALAGPSWQKRSAPAFQSQQGLVLVLDLSSSMLVADVTPNRLERARFKLMDLLKSRHEGQTGLVVFAGDAFAVSPLTDDVENIIEQAKNLSPDIMPVQGSRLFRGIDEAVELLQQAGYPKGDILLITDGSFDQNRALTRAEAANASGYRVSVAAIGTADGGPVVLSSGEILRDAQGQVVIAQLDTRSLQQIATQGGGLFLQLSLTDQEIDRFAQFFETERSGVLDDRQQAVEHWQNEGIWLLFLLVPFALLMFRKGYLFSLAAVCVVSGALLPPPAQAFSWDELWLNADQRAHKALLEEKPEEAKRLFEAPEWKASAAYRNGDFEEAASIFAQNQRADDWYNQGNALAKAEKIDEAIAAYSKALALQADHADARFNQELLKKMKEQQAQQNQDKNQQQDKQNSEDQKDSEDKQQSQSKQQQREDQQGSQDEQDSQKSESSDDQDSDSKQGEKSQQEKEADDKETQQAQDQQQSRQEQADQARKEAEEARDKQAEEQGEQQAEDKAEQQAAKPVVSEQPMTEEEKQQAQRTKQWLRKIPDDSVGLWRRKFQYQYRQRQPMNKGGEQLW